MVNVRIWTKCKYSFSYASDYSLSFFFIPLALFHFILFFSSAFCNFFFMLKGNIKKKKKRGTVKEKAEIEKTTNAA